MLSGRLQWRVEILKINRTPDGSGGYTTAWVNYATRWSDIQPLSGKERFAEGQIQNPTQIMFRLRYDPDVTAEMRIRYKGKVYQIIGQPINVRNEEIELEINAQEVSTAI